MWKALKLESGGKYVTGIYRKANCNAGNVGQGP